MPRSARLVLAVLLSALLVTPAAAAHAASPGSGPAAAPAERAVAVKAGKYVGRMTSGADQLEKVTLRVKNRKLTGFRVNLGVGCIDVIGGSSYISVRTVAFPSTKINARGKVNRTWKPTSGTTITLTATFTPRGKVKAAYLKYNSGICVRHSGWTAKRR